MGDHGEPAGWWAGRFGTALLAHRVWGVLGVLWAAPHWISVVLGYWAWEAALEGALWGWLSGSRCARWGEMVGLAAG